MALFLLPNGPMQTAAAMPPVTTGTSIKTLLQFKPSATLQAEVVEWGISFDGSAAATPGKVELIETDGAATVTAFVAADITKLDAAAIACGDPTTNLIQVGGSASGYTASNEGSITATRDLDSPQLIAPTNQFIKQFPLGCRPIVQVAKFLRIRVTFAAAINAYCYVVINI
jgi:hypothetical protein